MPKRAPEGAKPDKNSPAYAIARSKRGHFRVYVLMSAIIYFRIIVIIAEFSSEIHPNYRRASIADMTFQERIRSSYSLNTELFSTISSTSNASREVRETSQYITELSSRILIGTKNLYPLRVKVERLRTEYEALRDGSTKRLFSKISGKTEEHLVKTSQVEQEYQDAFEEQAQAYKNLETSKNNLEEAQVSLARLQDQAAIHTAAVIELDSLHDTIFALPHTEYSPETAAKQEVAQLQSPISDLQKQIDNETQALKLLANAHKYLIWSQAAILNAEASGYNHFHTAEARHLAVNIVRNALSTAQLHAMQAESAYDSAQLAQPGIQDLRELKILEKYLLGSFEPGQGMQLIDSKELWKKPRQCLAEIIPAIEEVSREIGVAEERAERLGDEKEDLEAEVRDVWRRARQEVIEMVMEGREVVGEGTALGTEEGEDPGGLPSYSP